jgi:GntR family transcriptional regulator, transcriptional repressor for pyruvate dehydrogenase complex
MGADDAQRRSDAGSGKRMERVRIADRIIEAIRTQITTGVYVRGERLPTERELATLYDVSPSTVREALRALSSMGLVDIRHGSGTYVAGTSKGVLNSSLGAFVQFDEVGVEDLIGFMRVLLVYSIELAVSRANGADIERLRFAAEATRHCSTADDVAAAVTEFLFALAAASHQPLIDGISGFLIDLTGRLERVSLGGRQANAWRRQAEAASGMRHKIVDALETRDTVAAVRAVDELHDQVTAAMRITFPSFAKARLSDPAFAPYVADVMAGR